MFQRRIPEWLRHAPTPGVRGFATLAGFEAVARGMLISVYPLTVYRALGDAELVSEVYFLIGIASLAVGLMVPWLNRRVPRRWLYSCGCLMFAGGSLLAIRGGETIVLALFMNTAATVMLFICFNAYVLDYISRAQLGQQETLRMFYSAAGWTVGPVVGVYLLSVWHPLPFLISAAAALSMLVIFLVMRLGNGRLIMRARAPATNPVAYLGRFFAQPRLVAGWLFAVLRSCGWWVYVVYLPIFAVESGLSDKLGGIVLSMSNGFLFLTPFMLRWIQRRSVRIAVRTGFLLAAGCFSAAWAAQVFPPLTVLLLASGSFFLVLLDMCGGLPFLMAVKPSERTEMSAVYSSFRDVSGIVTPGAAWLVLQVSPLAGVFLACGAGLFCAFLIAGSLHPRLGRARGGIGGRAAA